MLWDTTWHSHPYLEQSWLRNCPWHGQLCMYGGAVSVLAVLSCCPRSGLANCEDRQKEIMTIIGQEELNITPSATIFKTMYVWGNILLSADSFYRPHKSLVCTTCHRLPWKSVLSQQERSCVWMLPQQICTSISRPSEDTTESYCGFLSTQPSHSSAPWRKKESEYIAALAGATYIL